MLDEVSGRGLSWVNIVRPTESEMTILGQRYLFHRLNLDDCLSRIQLTKIERHKDHLFIILHFPIYAGSNRAVRSTQVSIFLGKDYLVTVHQGDLKPLMEMFQLCKSNGEKGSEFFGRSSSYLLYRIIDALVDALFPLLDKVLAELETIEDEVFDERIETVRRVTLIRREVADLRRILFSHRRVITELMTRVQQFTTDDLSVYLGDIKDHVEKVWETLEECKETIDIYKDTDFVLNTEKTNKILSFLTILFTLSIPATVIGTFYGMNINLPGGIQTGPPTFLGPYTTLLLIIMGSTISTASLTWYFHHLGWI